MQERQLGYDFHPSTLEALYQVGLEITAELDLDVLLQSIVWRATELLNGHAGGLHLYRPDQHKLEWTVAIGPSRAPLGTLLSKGEGVAGMTWQTGQPLVLNNDQLLPDRHSPPPRNGLPIKAVAAVPINYGNDFLGVLHVLVEPPRDFEELEVKLLSLFATQAAVAMRNAQLVRTLRDREEKLRQQTEELKIRNEELDAFAHTVAHDLKGPLTNLLTFTQILEEGIDSISPQDLEIGTETIGRSVRKVNNIIDELLLLSSIRKADLIRTPLEMGSIVKEACRRVKDLVKEYDAQIVVPDSWPSALGHGPWIEEVWVNYLSNALKYGGRPPIVELGSTILDDGSIRFWVKDNGPGLTTQQQVRLFTPFTQITNVRAQGYGLGLSIVQRIVEKLHGTVGVESEGIPGQGSLFFFTLPAGTEAVIG